MQIFKSCRSNAFRNRQTGNKGKDEKAHFKHMKEDWVGPGEDEDTQEVRGQTAQTSAQLQQANFVFLPFPALFASPSCRTLMTVDHAPVLALPSVNSPVFNFCLFHSWNQKRGGNETLAAPVYRRGGGVALTAVTSAYRCYSSRRCRVKPKTGHRLPNDCSSY